MRARLAAARVGRLATVAPSGAPRVVACCFVLEGDLVYSAVDHKPKRTPRLARLANIAGRPPVSLLADHYEEDWTRLWWVRADGRARELGAGEEAERERAIDALAAKYPQYRARRPEGPVIAIAIDRWTGWSAT